MRRDMRNSHHLATISFDGRFWDVYLELQEAQTPDGAARGRIAFSAADEGDTRPVRTAPIFLEETAQAVVNRARDFKTHQLVALLRSALPDDDPAPGTEDTEGRSPSGTREQSEGETGGAGPGSGAPPT